VDDDVVVEGATEVPWHFDDFESVSVHFAGKKPMLATI